MKSFLFFNRNWLIRLAWMLPRWQFYFWELSSHGHCSHPCPFSFCILALMLSNCLPYFSISSHSLDIALCSLLLFIWFLYKSRFIFILCIWMLAYMYALCHVCAGPTDVRCSRLCITDSCKPIADAESWTQILWKDSKHSLLLSHPSRPLLICT